MLRYYVKRSGGEDYQHVQTPPSSNVWIHGELVTSEELNELSRHYNLNHNILRDVLDKDELPRVETQAGATYVFVRTVQKAKHGRILTTPVLLAVKGDVFANVTAIQTTDGKLASPTNFLHSSAHDAGSMLLATFAAVVGEYEDLMKHTGRYIRDTAQRLRTHEVTNDDFIHFVTVEDNLNEYHMNLSAMLVVAQRLREIMPQSDDTESIEDILLYIRQLIVSIDSHNQSITSIRNAYGTIANNVLNQRMKTLTVLTVLIALPNVFYGMYGMNVALPFQQEPWAYGIVVFISITVMIAVFTIARKRGIF